MVMAVELLVAVQLELPVPVHIPDEVKFNVKPLSNWSEDRLVTSVVIVGTICRPEASVYAFLVSLVVQSKEPTPKPPTCCSKFHELVLIPFEKSSSNTIQY